MSATQLAVPAADATAEAALLTPYECAKVVNGMLQAAGVDKVLPPQMFYTYVKKGMIPATDKRVRPADLQKWAEGYFARNVK